MLKYIAALIVVVGMAFVIARQDQRAADQAAKKTTYIHKAASSANPNEQHPQEDVENPAGDRPSWYVLCFYNLFRWPNGTTTWAIILTLLAIAEQTSETRRSVLINLRPRVLIRGIEVPPANPSTDFIPPRDLHIEFVNAGGSDAHITDGNITFARETDFSDGIHIVLPAFPPYDPKSPKFGSFTIKAGEYVRRALQLDDNMSFTLALRDGGRKGSGTVRTGNMYCFGFVSYRDGLGINRRTGFAFRYNLGEDDFRRVDNPDYTYSD